MINGSSLITDASRQKALSFSETSASETNHLRVQGRKDGGFQSMYCPYCGDPLEERNQTFACTKGEIELSEHAGKRLYESFILKNAPPAQPVPTTWHWGGRWFCPACGIEMQQLAGTNGMMCSQCSGNLGHFIYELIEFNWHKHNQNT